MFTFSTAVSTHSTFPAEVVDAYASKGVQKPKTCISYLSVLHFLSKDHKRRKTWTVVTVEVRVYIMMDMDQDTVSGVYK